MYKVIYIIILSLLFVIKGDSQVFKGDSYTISEVMDEHYGIIIYKSLNSRLKGDSVRKCAGYACRGWVKDFYNTGAILHEGFYVDGQLQTYRNYFATGQLERVFKTTDDIKSVMTVYYLGGKIKSRVTYSKKFVRKWEDFFENGAPEFYEEYNKKIDFLIEQRYYHNNGKLKSSLILENKKKLLYNKENYYENGKLKAKGQIIYSMDILDYQKKGEWVFFDKNGKEKERKTF